MDRKCYLFYTLLGKKLCSLAEDRDFLPLLFTIHHLILLTIFSISPCIHRIHYGLSSFISDYGACAQNCLTFSIHQSIRNVVFDTSRNIIDDYIFHYSKNLTIK